MLHCFRGVVVLKKICLVCLSIVISFLATAESEHFEKINSQQMQALLASDTATIKVVNVWATWCAPCVREFPPLLALREKMEHESVEMIFVSADFASERDSAIRFLASQDVDFKTYWMRGDTDEFINGLSEDWSGALPATFVFNRRHELVYFYQGEVDISVLEIKINQSLAEEL